MKELDLRRNMVDSYLPYRYRKRDLGVLVLVYAVAVSLIWTQAERDLPGLSGDGSILTTFGGMLLLAELVSVLVMDWRGVVTLRGRMKWPRVSSRVVLLGLLALTFLTFGLFPLMVAMMVVGIGLFPMMFGVQPTLLGGLAPILLGVYLALSVVDYRESERRIPLERQRRIAELEAQLGILPDTAGHCSVCRQPVQLGANYCAYCRSPLAARPRICAKCATTAASDATWCPACGQHLDTSSSQG